MSELTNSIEIAYNDRRRECLSLDAKTLSTLFTNSDIQEYRELASRLARLFLAVWQSDLINPFYTVKSLYDICASKGVRFHEQTVINYQPLDIPRLSYRKVGQKKQERLSTLSPLLGGACLTSINGGYHDSSRNCAATGTSRADLEVVERISRYIISFIWGGVTKWHCPLASNIASFDYFCKLLTSCRNISSKSGRHVCVLVP